MSCAVCGRAVVECVGVLCHACAMALARVPPRAPGIVSAATAADAAEGWLIDEWGQLHPIPARCRIGRERAHNDMVLADLGVSAEHAELRRDKEMWILRDRGSANGSGVGDRSRIREAAVAHRARFWCGSVSFYLWSHRDPPAREVPAPAIRTVVPEAAAFRIESHQSTIVIRPARGHPLDRAPGELEHHARGSEHPKRGALPRLQFQLLRTLCEAAVAAPDERSRFVGTHELAETLPFQTARPGPNHVRQVVSTLRATLARADVADGLVASEEGLGYRVTWSVQRLGDPA